MKQADCSRCPDDATRKKVCKDKRHQCRPCGGSGIIPHPLRDWIRCPCSTENHDFVAENTRQALKLNLKWNAGHLLKK